MVEQDQIYGPNIPSQAVEIQLRKACKRILKTHKSKNFNTLKTIYSAIIYSFNQFSYVLRDEYDYLSPEEQAEARTKFRDVRDKTLAAFSVLYQWIKAQPFSVEEQKQIGLIKLPPSIGGQIIVIEAVTTSDEESTTSDEAPNPSANQPTIMTDTPFNLQQAISLVQTYDGNSKTLQHFIDSITFLNKITRAADNMLLLQFIKTRLVNKARDVAAQETTLETLIAKLREHCVSAVNSDTLRARLNAVRQRNDASKFAQEVEDLTNQLGNQYITEGVPPLVATKLANTAGIATIQKGARNPQTKLLLMAGNFTTLADATTKLLTEDNKPNEVASILALSQQQRGRNGDSRMEANS